MPEYQVTTHRVKLFTTVEADNKAEAIKKAMHPTEGAELDWEWEFTDDAPRAAYFEAEEV